MTEPDKQRSLDEWLQVFLAEKACLPESANQFHKFVTNRGGQASYSEARTTWQRARDPAPTPANGQADAASPQPAAAESRAACQLDKATTRPHAVPAQTSAPAQERTGRDLWLYQVRTALPGDVDALFRRLPEAARADAEVVRAAILRSARCLGDASPELRADACFMAGMVAESGIRLQFASEGLRGDRDVVLKAVRQHGAALQYASEPLRGDREVVLAALAAYRGDPHTHPFRWAAGCLRSDKEVALAALEQESVILASSWFPKALREDRDFMVRLISRNSNWLLQASVEMRSDKEIVLMAVRRDPFILRCVGAELRDDYDVVLAAMRTHLDSFRYAGPSMRDQKEHLIRMCDAKVILSLQTSDSTGALTLVKATTMGGQEVASVSVALGDSVSTFREALKSDLPPYDQAVDFVLPSGRLLSDIMETATVAELLSV